MNTRQSHGGASARHGARHLTLIICALTFAALATLPAAARAAAVRGNAGFTASTLPANDDDSTGLVGIGFTVNYFGLTFSDLYVNNNGNVTFDFDLSTYTPFDLTSTGQQIIAPFFADVDTRGAGSGVVTYGSDTVGGRPAFGVNWIDVGYFNSAVDKLNSFQLVLIDRSDLAPGDFDFEFNYDRIDWETGDASNGSGGLGGNSARAGFSNGTGDPGTFFELPGSAVNGGLLDTNPVTGLALNSNVGVPGRFLFQVRTGAVEVCGDGVTHGDEECDDGNTSDGDCCDSTCHLEPSGGGCDDDNACTTGDVCDGAGTCAGPTPLGCDDGNACTVDTCDPEAGCLNDDAPATGCAAASASLLLIKNGSDETRDKQLWKWIKGDALQQTDFGDPTAGAGYALCVYAGVAQTLIADAALAPGAGWKPLGAKGYKFKGTSADGLTTALLKGGAAGKSKALAKGKGAALPDPTLPVTEYPVTVQLRRIGAPLCLQSVFSSADETKNTAAQLKLKQ
jgi:cysteine-rich repeat protein